MTGKSDTWSLGVDAYRMFLGEYPFGQAGDSDLAIENSVIEYQKRGNSMGVPRGADIGMSGTEQRQLDRLIGGMLHPDPQQRPSLKKVLANPLISHPDVSGSKARELIQRLAA